jgi:ribosomal-protein-serine acetyltransferase
LSDDVIAFCLQIDEDLQLQLLEGVYADEYFQLTKKNQAYLKEWEPWASYESTLEGTQSYIRQMLHQFAESGGMLTGIWYQGRLIGSISLHSVNWADRKAEVGYWIDADWQGRGIVSRGCWTLVSYAFTHYHFNKVEIRSAAGNRKSRAVAERLGFRQDGVLRQNQFLNGRYVDIVVYSLLVGEWRERRRNT